MKKLTVLLILFMGVVFLYKDNNTRVVNIVDKMLICDYCEMRGYVFDYVEIEKDDADYITYSTYENDNLVVAGGINRKQLVENLNKTEYE